MDRANGQADETDDGVLLTVGASEAAPLIGVSRSEMEAPGCMCDPREYPGARMGRSVADCQVSGVEFAAYFVAIQAGGVERIRNLHYPRSNGLCGGCLVTPTTYPCQSARIAEIAERHAEYRPTK